MILFTLHTGTSGHALELKNGKNLFQDVHSVLHVTVYDEDKAGISGHPITKIVIQNISHMHPLTGG
jgi:hypothetical protein